MGAGDANDRWWLVSKREGRAAGLEDGGECDNNRVREMVGRSVMDTWDGGVNLHGIWMCLEKQRECGLWDQSSQRRSHRYRQLKLTSDRRVHACCCLEKLTLPRKWIEEGTGAVSFVQRYIVYAGSQP